MISNLGSLILFFELSNTSVNGLQDEFINLGPSVVQLLWVFSLRKDLLS